MIPYSGIDYFVAIAFFALLIYVGRLFTTKNLYFQTIIIAFCVWFFAFEVSSIMTLIIYFVANYLLLYLVLIKWKNLHGLIVSLVLLFPLAGSKISPDLSFFSFLGLSFVTFRVIQFYLDFAQIKVFPNPFKFFVYLFNPSWILIGPIDYYQRFDKNWNQIGNNYTAENIVLAFDHLILGLLQKLVLAHIVLSYVLTPVNLMDPGFSKFYLQMMGYMVYLYFDFAGYSNMAQGVSQILGIPLPANFNNPFIARNPQDFWKRWHITLSEWLGNYFFKPYYKWVSGKQKLKNFPLLKQNIGLFLTFVLMGVWNGFSWNFFLSGIMFGLYSIIYNSYLFTCRKKGKDIIFGNLSPTSISAISVVLMLHLNALAIYMFSGLLLSAFNV